MVLIQKQIYKIYDFNCQVLEKVVTDLKKYPVLANNHRFKGLINTIKKWKTKADAAIQKAETGVMIIYEDIFYNAYTLIYGKYLDLELLNYFDWVKKTFKKFDDENIINTLWSTWFHINVLQWWWYQLANHIDYETLSDMRPLSKASIAALLCNMNNSFIFIEMETNQNVIDSNNFQKLYKDIKKIKSLLKSNLTLLNFNEIFKIARNFEPQQSLQQIAATGDSALLYSLIIHYNLKIFDKIIKLIFKLSSDKNQNLN